MRDVNAAGVAEWLRHKGVEVRGTREAGPAADGEVDLGDGLHVQVGRGYACVCWWDDKLGQLHQGPARGNLESVLGDVLRTQLQRFLRGVRAGDTVRRMLAGEIPIDLRVTKVDGLIHCGPWAFHPETGGEVDPDLGWNGLSGSTGSYIIPPRG